MAAINLTSGHTYILCTENKLHIHICSNWGVGCRAQGEPEGAPWWRETPASLKTRAGQGGSRGPVF